MTENYFPMSLTFLDAENVTAAINQGIDSRLEAITQSVFTWANERGVMRLNCSVHLTDLPVLIRRLADSGDEDAELLADDIVTVAYGVEVF